MSTTSQNGRLKWRCRCSSDAIEFETGPVIAGEFCHCEFEQGFEKHVREKVPSDRPRDPFIPMLFVYSESMKLLSNPTIAASGSKKLAAFTQDGAKMPRYYCKACGAKLFAEGSTSLGMSTVFFSSQIEWDEKRLGDSAAGAARWGMSNSVEVGEGGEEGGASSADVHWRAQLGGKPRKSADGPVEKDLPHAYVRSSQLSKEQLKVVEEQITSGGAKGSLNDTLPPVPNGAFLRRFLAAKMLGCVYDFSPEGLPDLVESAENAKN